MNWSDYPNFSKREFDCKETGLNDMQPEFMRKLQELRDLYGKPMKITSGYRSKFHSAEVKKQQGSLLSQTDWAIVRKADKGTTIPSNIQTWRDGIRTKATQMETAIDNAADTDAVAALFLTWDKDGNKSGILYDWPELGD